MSNHKWILNDDGVPEVCEDVLKWAEWFEKNNDKRIVKQTCFPEGTTKKNCEVFVSTVFLCINHNFGMRDCPILWESMVFNGFYDGEMRRYSSKEDAEEGHEELCQLVASAIVNEEVKKC